VTTSKKTAPDVIEQLKQDGAHVTTIALLEKFHWQQHRDAASRHIKYCVLDPSIQPA
jgi:hypothetical protein